MATLTWKPYRRPFRTPLRTAHGQWACREGLIVRLEQDGVVGYGEIAPLESFGTESLAEAEAYLMAREQEPELPVPPELVCTRFALDTAVGALKHAPARTLHVAALLPADSAALQAVEALLEQGFTTFKWKIGVVGFETERPLCAELFKRLHGRGILRLDANAGLDREQAESWLGFLEDYPVEFLEQPLPPEQEAQMASLAQRFQVPIALDESLCGAGALERWSELFPNGPFVIKPALIGAVQDYLNWRHAHPATRIIYSSAFETAVGIEAALRLAAQDEHCSEAIGFGTLESFPREDQLGWHTHGPTLTAGGYSPQAADALWKQL